MVDKEKWEADILRIRSAKDEFFVSGHFQSPILYIKQSHLEGLDYFLQYFAYGFEITIHERSKKKVIKIKGSKGGMRESTGWGEFCFKTGDKNCTLQAYNSNPNEERLPIFIRDATSGKETYGAGIYLDIEPDGYQTTGHKWIVDFNFAYDT